MIDEKKAKIAVEETDAAVKRVAERIEDDGRNCPRGCPYLSFASWENGKMMPAYCISYGKWLRTVFPACVITAAAILPPEKQWTAAKPPECTMRIGTDEGDATCSGS